jgi:hypothetical protein
MIEALQYQGKIYKQLHADWQNPEEVFAIYQEGQMKLFHLKCETYDLEPIRQLRLSKGFLLADTSSISRKRVRPIDIFFEV